MRKVLSVLLFSFLLIGCVSEPKKNVHSFSNKSQSEFEKILFKYNENKYSYKNEIQRIEGLKSFDNEILNFIDSSKFFVNWEAVISDIDISDRFLNSKKYKVLTFTLFYEPDEYREVRFKCLKAIEEDSISTDLIYNNIKNIGNYTTVYFDGIIRKGDDGLISYDSHGGASDDMRFPYPSFNFNIFNITQSQRVDSISTTLKSLVNIDMNIIDFMAKSTNKKEVKEHTEMYVTTVDSLRKLLTSDEIYWRNQFMNHYINEIANLN